MWRLLVLPGQPAAGAFEKRFGWPDDAVKGVRNSWEVGKKVVFELVNF